MDGGRENACMELTVLPTVVGGHSQSKCVRGEGGSVMFRQSERAGVLL